MSTLKTSRIGLFVVLAMVVSALSASPALAVNDSTLVETTAGTLSFNYADEIAALTGVTLDGTSRTDLAAGSLTTFDVIDARGSGAGWNVSLAGRAASTTVNPALKLYCTAATVGDCVGQTANTYHTGVGIADDGLAFPVTGLTLDSDVGSAASWNVLNGTSGGTNLPTHSCNAVCQVGGDTTSRKIASAALDAGMGSFSVVYQANQLLLDVPTEINATAGNAELDYRADLDIVLNNVP